MIKDPKRVSHTAVCEKIPKAENQVITCKCLKGLTVQRPAGDQVVGVEWARKRDGQLDEGCGGYCEDSGSDSQSKLREMFTHLYW